MCINVDECYTWPSLVDWFYHFLRANSYPINHKEFITYFHDIVSSWEEAEKDEDS